MIRGVAQLSCLMLCSAAAPGCGNDSRSSGVETDSRRHTKPEDEEDPLPEAYADTLAAVGDFDGDGATDLAIGSRSWGSDDRGIVDLRFLDAEQGKLATETLTKKSNGFTGRIDHRDWLGASIASPGDLDGDAVSDLAIGAPGDGDGGRDAGAVWILFLEQPTGRVGHLQKISALEGQFTGALAPRDRFGWALAALGDVDGDAVLDLAVGAPRDDEGNKDAGAVWIVFLAADGTVRSQQKIAARSGGLDATLPRKQEFGAELAPLGDLDADGVPDLAVGVPFDGEISYRAGAVWLLFLRADGTVKARRKLTAAQGGFVGPLAERDRFGSALAVPGDLDGDGTLELAVGAESETRELKAGAVWILSLGLDGAVQGELRIAPGESGLTSSLPKQSRFGAALAAPGDLDGDQVPDLVVGAPGRGTGRFWFLYLNGDGTVRTAWEEKR